jgi:hypothetical protein
MKEDIVFMSCGMLPGDLVFYASPEKFEEKCAWQPIQ